MSKFFTNYLQPLKIHPYLNEKHKFYYKISIIINIKKYIRRNIYNIKGVFQMKHLFIAFLLVCLTIHAQTSYIQDITTIKNKMKKEYPTPSNFSNQIKKPAKPTLHKIMATIGSATITYSKYPFEWLIIPGGWYWESTDEYTSFYFIKQRHENFSTYKATLGLDIYKINISPLDAATAGVNRATNNNANFYEKKVKTTFNGYTAYKNSFVEDYFSYDEWYFEINNQTYTYQIFTTVNDWNENKNLYTVLTLGLILPENTLSKSNAISNKTYNISYINSNNITKFLNVPKNTTMNIYNIKGVLLKTLYYNQPWDGTSSKGKISPPGFYISKINDQSLYFYKK